MGNPNVTVKPEVKATPKATPKTTNRDAKAPKKSPSSTTQSVWRVGTNSFSIRAQPKVVQEAPKRWDETKRHELDPDQKSAFIKEATGYALSKSNKLSLVNFKQDSEGKLEEVHQLQTQLKLLKTHLESHDIIDVFTITLPKDVLNSPELYTPTYDLSCIIASSMWILSPTAIAGATSGLTLRTSLRT